MDAQSLPEILELSGDANLISFCFENGELNIKLKLLMNEPETLQLYIKTLRFENESSVDVIEMQLPLFIDLVTIGDRLSTEKGYYVPNPSFQAFMKECRNGLNLVYGLKADPNLRLLHIRGSIRYISCIVENIESDIRWELK